MPLWIVRHAKPLIDNGICYGALDIPANTSFTDQSALNLHQKLPLDTIVICSPLQRCQQLMQALKVLRPSLIFEHEPKIAEMNFGFWEGIPWSQIPKVAIDAWIADFGEHKFGGVESVNCVLERVKPLYERSISENQPILWITHAGIVRSVALLSKGIYTVKLAEQWPHDGLGFGEYLRVDT